MGEIIHTTSADEFNRVVVEGSKEKPKLVIFGGEWCKDCVFLEEKDVFKGIADERKDIDVIEHIVPIETVRELWAFSHEDEARSRGFDVPAVLSLEAQLLSNLQIDRYPSALLIDGGEAKVFYIDGEGNINDRAVDSDFVKIELIDHQTGRRDLVKDGEASLYASINRYMENRG